MNEVIVRIPTPLRSFTGGADEVTAKGATAREALADLVARHSGLRSRLLDSSGELRQFVNVFRGSENLRSLQGLDTAVAAGDVLAIIPAVAGGAR